MDLKNIQKLQNMDLVYTCYRSPAGLRRAPGQLEGSCLSAVSAHNCLLFTTSGLLPEREAPARGGHVYSTDLNTPWAAAPVCPLEGEATCLAWDQPGGRFLVADSAGRVQVWRRDGEDGAEWRRLASATYPLENFVAGGFFLNSRPVCIRDDRRESRLYNEKFSAAGSWSRSSVPGCVFVSSSGLLVCFAFPPDLEPVVASQSLGLGRRRIEQADCATTREGRFVVAAGGSLGPVVVYTVTAALRQPDGGLQLRIATHSSLSVDGGPRLCSLRFLLAESTEALVLGLEGGRVQMWRLEARQRQLHKLFGAGERGQGKAAPEWRFTDEFSGGGSMVAGLATPRSSMVGGARPACYVAVAFSDGSVQCLLRDSLQQIESVELPRGGNLGWGSKAAAGHRPPSAVTICSLAFTSTGNCLVVVDSLGQLYLYTMSPIADPGGPSSTPYTVQALEYCLVSGKDWWDLAIAFKPSSRLESVCDRFGESFAAQPAGLQRYYHSRFMAMKASIYRLANTSQYRAADTTALLMLQSVNGAFKTLLRPADGPYSDLDPTSKLEMELTGPEETQLDIDQAVLALVRSGLGRELSAEPATLQTMQHLAAWATTLALHLVASVPDSKARRGPGCALLGGPEALPLLRELLAMMRLWNLPRVSVISMEKEFDLTARLFAIITRLMKKQDEEALVDECLMLPHKVMIPALDTVQGSRGVAASLAVGSPLTFTLGLEPVEPPAAPAAALEGLTYTEDPNSNFFYDCVQKMYLGESW
jgi:mediator of RNA polymerase II transcription subunit 16